MEDVGVVRGMRDPSHRPVLAPYVGISGCNSVDSGGAITYFSTQSPTIAWLKADGNVGVVGASTGSFVTNNRFLPVH